MGWLINKRQTFGHHDRRPDSRDFGHDPARHIRVIRDTDDLVVGSGPGGIDREFKGCAKAMGAAPPASQSLSCKSDSEGCKLLAHRLVEEAGIHPCCIGRSCLR